MFTGIVTAIGTIESSEQRGDLRCVISCPWDTSTIPIGASICCSGVCLTVVECGENTFTVDISGETVARSVPGMWDAGAKLNLEPSLKLGDELGGHIVTGHVDGVGQVVFREETGDSIHLAIHAPADLAAYIAAKGSITVNGVSLTVNKVTDQRDGSADFELNIIPHTGEVTTLGGLSAGDQVNLEIDVLARYLKRMESLRVSNAVA